MSNIYEITETVYNTPISYLASIFGAAGTAQNTSRLDNGVWVSVPYALVCENELPDIISGWGALSLTYSAGEVTLSPGGLAACYVWYNGVKQPEQDPFTASDPTLGGLTVPGNYLVIAYDAVTGNSGYIEFEVT